MALFLTNPRRPLFILKSMVYQTCGRHNALDGTLHCDLKNVPGNNLMELIYPVIEAHRYLYSMKFISACATPAVYTGGD